MTQLKLPCSTGYADDLSFKAKVTTVIAFLPTLVILDDRGQLPSRCPKIALGMCHLLPLGVEWLVLRGP